VLPAFGAFFAKSGSQPGRPEQNIKQLTVWLTSADYLSNIGPSATVSFQARQWKYTYWLGIAKHETDTVEYFATAS
jgi:hypothetical protein